MIEIIYYTKEIITCDDPLKCNDHIAKQYAGFVDCPSCGNDHATVINDTDEVKNWSIECGECDFQVYGVKVILKDEVSEC
jgi:hypothetical protein